MKRISRQFISDRRSSYIKPTVVKTPYYIAYIHTSSIASRVIIASRVYECNTVQITCIIHTSRPPWTTADTGGKWYENTVNRTETVWCTLLMIIINTRALYVCTVGDGEETWYYNIIIVVETDLKKKKNIWKTKMVIKSLLFGKRCFFFLWPQGRGELYVHDQR